MDYHWTPQGARECEDPVGSAKGSPDQDGCFRFARQLFSKKKYIVRYDPYYPPGCIVDLKEEVVQFNTHPTGWKGYADWFHLVCIAGFHLAPKGDDSCKFGYAVQDTPGKPAWASEWCDKMVLDRVELLEQISPIDASWQNGTCVVNNRLVCSSSLW